VLWTLPLYPLSPSPNVGDLGEGDVPGACCGILANSHEGRIINPVHIVDTSVVGGINHNSGLGILDVPDDDLGIQGYRGKVPAIGAPLD